MKLALAIPAFFGLALLLPAAREGLAYPPGVGILSKAQNCLSCHAHNGPWKDDARTIIDVLDAETKASLKQPDGSFLVEVPRGAPKTVLTVLGRTQEDPVEAPYRNGWLYVDPKTIESSSLSKFAPGWDVNLPGACRVVGDRLDALPGAKITLLPMTVRPTDAAQDAEILLQAMLTKGESVKGKPLEGMRGSYFERKVRLKVKER
jgi:hypothetical protein